MQVKLRAIGNSAGIIFPNALLKHQHLHIGDDLEAREVGNTIVLSAVKKQVKYKLKDLVAQSKKESLTDEDKTWFNMEDIGKEIVWK